MQYSQNERNYNNEVLLRIKIHGDAGLYDYIIEANFLQSDPLTTSPV